MPRSSSLAITIVRTATDALADPGEIRALIDAAIEHMTQIAGLPETPGPSAAAARAGTPDCGLSPPQHEPDVPQIELGYRDALPTRLVFASGHRVVEKPRERRYIGAR